MPSTLVTHSLHTRVRHLTQIPMASRDGWFLHDAAAAA